MSYIEELLQKPESYISCNFAVDCDVESQKNFSSVDLL